MDLNKLSEQEKIGLITRLEQRERERVTDKMEQFRDKENKWRILMARGGRGAGAKSTSVASILINRANYEKLRVVCLREVQRSLEESNYRLMVDTIVRLQYQNWKITREYLDSPGGSHIIFRGLADLRAANQIKGLEGLDVAWIDEAATVSDDSLRLLLPTLRKENSKLYITYNPESEFDPVTVRLWNSTRNDVLRIELEQGKIDNEWFNDTLQREMDADYARNPDEALHTWGGQPRKQGDNAVLSRVLIRQAMSRDASTDGPCAIGVDVARFGSDFTVIYKRKGLKIIDFKELSKRDTVYVAQAVWDIAGQTRECEILVDDTGVGGGVTDILRTYGAKVVPINFGSAPMDKDKYVNFADQLWFDFADKINEVSIPDDQKLMEELSGRLYGYDNRSRKKIESKEDFRKRYGRSPDRADALLLCFCTNYRRGSSVGFAALKGI